MTSQPITRRSFFAAAAAAVATACGLTGCRGILRGVDGSALYGAAPTGPVDNPLFVPPLDPEFVWNNLVDAVDDHFLIEREERVRLIGGILTEGRIDTYPRIGSTLLEPWRGDSTPGYEKLHATLQSIRRKATVRLIPTEGGALVDVVVQKELEDLDKPENATAGNATLRHDGTLVRNEGPPGRFSVTLGWIPIGRDCSLEQKILRDIQCRLNVPGTGASPTSVPPEQMESSAETIAPGEMRPGGPSNSGPSGWQPRPGLESLPAPRGPGQPQGNILLPSQLPP
ncbi:hypothetical protein [Anatilimnocola floriformis]|uniref:hypothetical protein n=1 Tax=Anatilimnocola floriformis TaxID=2948575 RepID=UPI0020C1DE67|nr:hypothetical protein [Anatilimnocola floriformis]